MEALSEVGYSAASSDAPSEAETSPAKPSGRGVAKRRKANAKVEVDPSTAKAEKTLRRQDGQKNYWDQLRAGAAEAGMSVKDFRARSRTPPPVKGSGKVAQDIGTDQARASHTGNARIRKAPTQTEAEALVSEFRVKDQKWRQRLKDLTKNTSQQWLTLIEDLSDMRVAFLGKAETLEASAEMFAKMHLQVSTDAPTANGVTAEAMQEDELMHASSKTGHDHETRQSEGIAMGSGNGSSVAASSSATASPLHQSSHGSQEDVAHDPGQSKSNSTGIDCASDDKNLSCTSEGANKVRDKQGATATSGASRLPLPDNKAALSRSSWPTSPVTVARRPEAESDSGSSPNVATRVAAGAASVQGSTSPLQKNLQNFSTDAEGIMQAPDTDGIVDRASEVSMENTCTDHANGRNDDDDDNDDASSDVASALMAAPTAEPTSHKEVQSAGISSEKEATTTQADSASEDESSIVPEDLLSDLAAPRPISRRGDSGSEDESSIMPEDLLADLAAPPRASTSVESPVASPRLAPQDLQSSQPVEQDAGKPFSKAADSKRWALALDPAKHWLPAVGAKPYWERVHDANSSFEEQRWLWAVDGMTTCTAASSASLHGGTQPPHPFPHPPSLSPPQHDSALLHEGATREQSQRHPQGDAEDAGDRQAQRDPLAEQHDGSDTGQRHAGANIQEPEVPSANTGSRSVENSSSDKKKQWYDKMYGSSQRSLQQTVPPRRPQSSAATNRAMAHVATALGPAEAFTTLPTARRAPTSRLPAAVSRDAPAAKMVLPAKGPTSPMY